MKNTSDTKAPTVTVLMATYNDEPYLAEALASVLNQSYTDFEIVIVEDGSTDKTRSVLNSIKDKRIVKLYNSENKGLIYSLNLGLGHARGKYIARFDSDDIMLPGRLKSQVAYLERHPKVDIVSGQTLVMRDYYRTGIFINPITKHGAEIGLLAKCTISHNCVTFRRELLERLGLSYSDEYMYMEDYGLWANVAGNAKIHISPRRFAVYRKYDSSITEVIAADEEKDSILLQSRRKVLRLLVDKFGIALPDYLFENYVRAMALKKDVSHSELCVAIKSILSQIPKGKKTAIITLLIYYWGIWWKVTECTTKGKPYAFLNFGAHIFSLYKRCERKFYQITKLKISKVI
ncbi:MAG: glycosyltransferase family 2 protein [Clostridia bacterium]|nr:glycosyltransferase family 2 protein [Clostridia bacterium]